MSLAVSLFLLLVSSAIIAYIHVFTRVCPCRWDGYKGDDGEDFALFTTVFSFLLHKIHNVYFLDKL